NGAASSLARSATHPRMGSGLMIQTRSVRSSAGTILPRKTRQRTALATVLACLLVVGCNAPQWRQTHKNVLDPEISKETLVAHLNERIEGGGEFPGLRSWRSGTVKVHLDGVPVAL